MVLPGFIKKGLKALMGKFGYKIIKEKGPDSKKMDICRTSNSA